MATPIVAPLTGTVTPGTWVVNKHFTLAGSPSGLGYMNFNYVLPANYNSAYLYPILFVNHPLDGGMNGSSYPRDGNVMVSGTFWGGTYNADNMFNSVAFQTAFPSVIVLCQQDQTNNLGGTAANGVVGYNDSQNSSWNEQAINGILQAFVAGTVVSGLQIDPGRRYTIGYSLGGILTLGLLADNNQWATPAGGIALWTAGITYSDQLARATSNSSIFSRMKTVPLLTISTTGDNVPTSYDQPAWTAYTGNTSYPSQSNYDSGGMSSIRAGTSQYYYINYGSGQPAQTFMPLNSNGGDGTKAYVWLFSQVFGGAATPPGTRKWYQEIGGDRCILTTPIQTTATYINSGAAYNQLQALTAHIVQPSPYWVGPLWVSTSTSDVLCTVHDATNTIPDFQMHVPAGAYTEGKYVTDNGCGFIDSSIPYKYVTINVCYIGSNASNANVANVVSSTNNFIVAGNGMLIQDATGPLYMDALTGSANKWQNSDNISGGITYWDLQQCNADPNFVIRHSIMLQIGPSVFNGSNIWPLVTHDTGGTGSLPEGVVIFIPQTTPRPTGQTRGFYVMWDVLQQYGGVFNNVTAAGEVNCTAQCLDSATTSLASDMGNNFGSVWSQCRHHELCHRHGRWTV